MIGFNAHRVTNVTIETTVMEDTQTWTTLTGTLEDGERFEITLHHADRDSLSVLEFLDNKYCQNPGLD